MAQLNAGAFDSAYSAEFDRAVTEQMCGYASVHDYEVRTGQKVPLNLHDTYCMWLGDNSTIIELYLGPCADAVEATYPDVLAMLTVQRTQRMASIPAGVAATSIGGTSVTFTEGRSATTLSASESDLLDRLIAASCGELGADEVPGLGQLGAAWGGKDSDEDINTLWVVASPQRRKLRR